LHPGSQPRRDWLSRSIVCGYFASIAMLIVALAAYITVLSVSQAEPGMGGWAYSLVHNRVVDVASDSPYLALAVHFLAGIAFAMVYAYWVEPRSAVPGWMQGTAFAMAPFLLSVFVFLPWMGVGVLGGGMKAGPLPAVGNLLLHLAYGLTLGLLYSPVSDQVMAGDRKASPQALQATLEGSERGATRGLVIGTLAGLVVGFGFSLTMGQAGAFPNVPASVVPLTCGLVGSALGCLAGLVLGQPQQSGRVRTT
jgi:hypothetical protein